MNKVCSMVLVMTSNYFTFGFGLGTTPYPKIESIMMKKRKGIPQAQRITQEPYTCDSMRDHPYLYFSACYNIRQNALLPRMPNLPYMITCRWMLYFTLHFGIITIYNTSFYMQKQKRVIQKFITTQISLVTKSVFFFFLKFSL